MRLPFCSSASLPLLSLPLLFLALSSLLLLSCSGPGSDDAPSQTNTGAGGSGSTTVNSTGGTGAGGDPTAMGGAGAGTGGTPIAGDPFAVFYRGANLSGAEHGIENDGTENWGDATPGAEGSQYAWPDPETNAEMDEVALFLERGMNF